MKGNFFAFVPIYLGTIAMQIIIQPDLNNKTSGIGLLFIALFLHKSING